ncbi:MAG: hypothetical protein BAJALOKI3v1_230027 [Promethearchaeota archaeon]|nr:MAG: hypothetical protein BAJALOKI3v1_230027 [Candidatus Lokiarchaeota archaeon]
MNGLFAQRYFIMNRKEDISEEDLDDLLDKTFAMQDQIHHKCEIRDDPKKKQEEWDKKYK